jgi:pyridoxine/pyridoxamine 5'-phosphate oxidase
MKNNYPKPIQTFANWLNEAELNQKVINPKAVNIATVNKKNQPSSKMALLTKFDDWGFFVSQKSSGDELLNINQSIALCFYWGVLSKQVRVEGKITKQDNVEWSSLINFLVIPQTIEFWMEGKFRIHKRIKYQKTGSIWQATRLYP